MRCLLVTALLLLAGCVAKWDALVKYSPEPAPPGSLDAGIYRELATELKTGWRFDTVYLRLPLPESGRTQQTSPLVASVIHDRYPTAPKHWSDSLRKEVNLSLRHADTTGLADPVEVAAMFRAAGLTAVGCQERHCPLPNLSIYRPGYNRDSTMAALRTEMTCGGLCGRGLVAMYARRPGTAWRQWWGFLEWIS